MALNLDPIFRAMAAQLKAAIVGTNVYPFPEYNPALPAISIYPDQPIDYLQTFGPNGGADVFIKLKVEVDGEAEPAFAKMCEYLSVGTGNPSSIFDALRADKTVGGTVDDCLPRTAEWEDPAPGGPYTAWVYVHLLTKKLGAQP